MFGNLSLYLSHSFRSGFCRLADEKICPNIRARQSYPHTSQHAYTCTQDNLSIEDWNGEKKTTTTMKRRMRANKMLQNETFFNACRFLGSSITNLKFSLVIFCASLSFTRSISPSLCSRSEWKGKKQPGNLSRKDRMPAAKQNARKTYSTHNQADKLKTKQEDDNE